MYRPTFHPKNDLILGLFFGKIASELVYTRYQYEHACRLPVHAHTCSALLIDLMLTAYLTVISVHTTRTMVAAFSPGWNPIEMKSDEQAHM